MNKKRKKIAKSTARNKTRLGLPDLDQAKAAVLNSLRSPESQRGYQHAMDEFIAWYCSEPRLSFNKTVVTEQRSWELTSVFIGYTTTAAILSSRRSAQEQLHDGQKIVEALA